MFEYFKERRSAAVFYTTLIVLPGGLALTWLVYTLAENPALQPAGSIILVVVGCLLALLLLRRCRQWSRRGRMGRYQSTPLSDDERVKARRKLAGKTVLR